MKNLKKAIIVWRFEDAPEEYQKLVDDPSDRNWLAFIPNCYKYEYISWTESCSFDSCQEPEIYKVKGGVIKIGGH